ncbi:hypothetical protein DFA_05115 [Cavenderia fasciculata]|uniref:Uncharacterized protein n=1 Tax=Cavenderia fasciculata TaxID=261658 RepID=F4PND2_CACFS|nr:uncharacterized protein DFA_05115 [Cavenderia fasciculata]EGG22985.1 hypothetical protein DFA_05115 [Cavenderia fasciculata]|eukprot:XP_004360836.1 hypothetical protein DFA_05115 [Cavenderia fasciculata]
MIIKYDSNYAPLVSKDRQLELKLLPKLLSYDSNFNPEAALFGTFKPTQHIFCSNIDSTASIESILKLLSTLNKEGDKENEKLLAYILHNDHNDGLVNTYVKNLSGNEPLSKDIVTEDIENDDIKEDNDDNSNPGTDASMVGKGIPMTNSFEVFASRNRLGEKDVWRTLDKSLGPTEKMVVSTWSSYNGDPQKQEKGLPQSLDRPNIVPFNTFTSPEIRFGEVKGRVSWRGFSMKEHSKIGFKMDKATNSEWDMELPKEKDETMDKEIKDLSGQMKLFSDDIHEAVEELIPLLVKTGKHTFEKKVVVGVDSSSKKLDQTKSVTANFVSESSFNVSPMRVRVTSASILDSLQQEDKVLKHMISDLISKMIRCENKLCYNDIPKLIESYKQKLDKIIKAKQGKQLPSIYHQSYDAPQQIILQEQQQQDQSQKRKKTPTFPR